MRNLCYDRVMNLISDLRGFCCLSGADGNRRTAIFTGNLFIDGKGFSLQNCTLCCKHPSIFSRICCSRGVHTDQHIQKGHSLAGRDHKISTDGKVCFSSSTCYAPGSSSIFSFCSCCRQLIDKITLFCCSSSCFRQLGDLFYRRFLCSTCSTSSCSTSAHQYVLCPISQVIFQCV